MRARMRSNNSSRAGSSDTCKSDRLQDVDARGCSESFYVPDSSTPGAGEVKQIGKHGASEINGVPVIPQTKEHVMYNVFGGIQVIY